MESLESKEQIAIDRYYALGMNNGASMSAGTSKQMRSIIGENGPIEDPISAQIRERLYDMELKVAEIESFVSNERVELQKYEENNAIRRDVLESCRRSIEEARNNTGREKRVAELLGRLLYINNE